MSTPHGSASPIVVLCTVPASQEGLGEDLARQLLDQRLAACVNIVPQIRSLYRWEGKVQCDREEQLIIKTRRENLPALVAWLESHHPYDVPEVLALSVEGGSEAYIGWLLAEASGDSSLGTTSS